VPAPDQDLKQNELLAQAQLETQKLAEALAQAQAEIAAGKAALAPPLPSPPKPRQESVPSSILIDIPCCFLYDRSGWPEFKRSLNECGLSWNLPDWMTTIVHHGTEWKSIVSQGTDLNSFFPVLEKKNAGDGASSKASPLGAKLTELLGLPKNMGDAIRPAVQFCCLSTVEFEANEGYLQDKKCGHGLFALYVATNLSARADHYLFFG
jgi:hypothetical protein